MDAIDESGASLAIARKSADLLRAEATAARLYRIDFAWDINKALEFALLRTYGAPSISSLLDRTNETVGRPQKRYDDTVLIVVEILLNGLDSPRATRAYKRLNDMHGRYRIANDDFLYVLSTFIFSPIDWIARYGRRALTQAEIDDWFFFWRAFGERMGIQNIFADMAEFRAFQEDFERTSYAPSPSNGKVARGSMNVVLNGYFVPHFMRPLGYRIVMALCAPHLVAALGYREPSRLFRGAVNFLMQCRRAFLRRVPLKRNPIPQYSGAKTYPEGYEIEELGTFKASR